MNTKYKNHRLFRFGPVAAVLFLGSIILAMPSVYASNLTFTSDVSTPLSNGTITIASGSTADSLVIDSSDIVIGTVGTSSANLSSLQNMAVAGSSATQTCVGGIGSVSISGNTTATITLLPTFCPYGGIGSVSAGSGVGGGGGYVPPSAATSSVNTSSSLQNSPANTQALKQIIAQLQIKLAGLIAQAEKAGIHVSASGTPLSGVKAQAIFSRNLGFGMVGDDVKLLQQFLIKTSTGRFAKELEVYSATGYFGTLTKQALAEYQARDGIESTGYFGPKTRVYVNSHQ